MTCRASGAFDSDSRHSSPPWRAHRPDARPSRLLTDVADRQSRDGRPQRVIGSEDTVIAMPVFTWRRDEIGEPVEELKRRELDDAIGSRPRGLPPTTPPDPVGRLVPREHVADLGDAAGWAADHGQSLQCKGGAAPPEAPESLISRKTGAEVPLTGLSFRIAVTGSKTAYGATSKKTSIANLFKSRRKGNSLVVFSSATHHPLVVRFSCSHEPFWCPGMPPSGI